MTKDDPYLWQYPMAYDEIFENLGIWSCRRLLPGNAVHAGPDYRSTPRKFAIILVRVERE